MSSSATRMSSTATPSATQPDTAKKGTTVNTSNGAIADTTAALRASEIRADIILKATKVDGIYDRDPNTDSNAQRFDRLTFSEALTQRLQVMDSTAFSLCMDNKIPIVVFDMNKPSNFTDIVLGKKVGTIVSE